MAVNLLSPGVKITEADLVTSVPAAGPVVAASVGNFRWGPINQPVLVSSEADLVAKFGAPNSTNTLVDFLVAANFLAYSGAEYVVRAANTLSANNATAENTTGSGNPGVGTLIENDDDYLNTLEAAGSNDHGPWIAKFAGSVGNSLKISVCPSPAAWQANLTSVWSVTNGSNTATANTTTAFGNAVNEVAVGDQVTIGTKTFTVKTVTNANTIVFTVDSDATLSNQTVVRKWEYQNAFDAAPGTSVSAELKGAANDEIHLVVVDEDGLFSGTRGTILEKYAGLSKAVDGRSVDGGSNYYKTVVNTRSRYVRWADHDDIGSNWGEPLVDTSGAPETFTETKPRPASYSLAGGSDGAPGQGDKQLGFALFENKETYGDVTVLIAGDASGDTVDSLIAIAEKRKDLMVCFSPEKDDVVNAQDPTTAVNDFANGRTRSNYAIMDSGWKYQYNKYGDNYVWVPLCADIAGCLARTDQERAAWFSPAGYVQGRILNVVKLAWNPDQNARDALYKNAVNPVINQPGRGTILFGDKTFTTRPGSFSRINVRRLFITLEKSIGALATNLLFEQNDEGTRAGFVNTIEPYLRSVQAQRGIAQFVVVCNDTNNPEDIVNANAFVADIYVRPVSSINFIQLNFVSVAGAAQFAAIGG